MSLCYYGPPDSQLCCAVHHLPVVGLRRLSLAVVCSNGPINREGCPTSIEDVRLLCVRSQQPTPSSWRVTASYSLCPMNLCVKPYARTLHRGKDTHTQCRMQTALSALTYQPADAAIASLPTALPARPLPPGCGGRVQSGQCQRSPTHRPAHGSMRGAQLLWAWPPHLWREVRHQPVLARHQLGTCARRL